jgi:hypothetical protein
MPMSEKDWQMPCVRLQIASPPTGGRPLMTGLPKAPTEENRH